MSQIIACKTENGIILAADSKAVEMDAQGQLAQYSIRRLFQLTPQTAIMTGGVVQGAKMCESLQDFIGQEQLEDIVDVYNAALPFLATEYERYMRKACEFLPLDPIHQIHFILAGYCASNPQNPFQLYLIWTKKKLPQMDGDEISTAYAVPRLMTLEYQLNQQCRKNKPFSEIVPSIRKHFEKQSAVNDDVAGPFSLASITQDGFRVLSD